MLAFRIMSQLMVLAFVGVGIASLYILQGFLVSLAWNYALNPIGVQEIGCIQGVMLVILYRLLTLNVYFKFWQ